MKKIIFLTLFAFFAITLMQAQPMNRGLGLVEDNEAYDKIERVANFTGSKFTNLPLKANLKKYCPEIANQGDIGSCVGWSSSYGALTIMAAQQQNWETTETINQNAYSSLYIYNQIKIANCYSGAKISDAMKLMKDQGTCYSENFDNPAESCDRAPGSSLQEEAKQNRIQDYFVLFDRKERKKSKIFKTKKSLADGKPVILGMKVRQNFLDLPHGTDTWKPMEGDSTPIGGHAMVIIGYHDGKKAFEVMNSWGKEWGNDGFAWIPYDVFADHAVYGYQILLHDVVPATPETNAVTIDTPNESQSMEDIGPTLQGDFVFQYPIFSESEDIEFEEAKPVYVDNYYVLQKKDWEIGQLFQLVAKNIKKDSYVYVFSVDAKKSVHIHFPQNRKFEAETFKTMNQSAIVPFDDAEIVIPNEEEALAKEHIGTDYLCVLYSTKEVTDIKEIIQKTVSNDTGDFVNALNTALGDRAFSTDDINYSINRISCEAYNDSGSIIPIILEVEGQ